MMAGRVEATEEGCGVLGTILALAVTLFHPVALLAAHLQACQWVWPEVQWHLHQLGPPSLAPTAVPPPTRTPPGPTLVTCPGSMWPRSRSCPQWDQHCVCTMLAQATHCKRRSQPHCQSSGHLYPWVGPLPTSLTAAFIPVVV